MPETDKSSRQGLFSSIRSQLLFLFSVLLVIIFFVVASFIWFLSENSKIDEVTGTINHINLNIKDANILENKFFTFETINPSFYETGKSKYISEHNVLIAEIRTGLKRLRSSSVVDDELISTKIDRITHDIAVQTQLFDSLVQMNKRRGFADYGLIGEMQDAIEIIESSGLNYDRTSLLNIKSNEKDYHWKRDPNYLKKVKVHIDFLSIAILSVPNKPQEKARLLKHVNFYSNGVDALRIMDQHIGYYTGKGLNSKLAMYVSKIAEGLNEVGLDISGKLKKTSLTLKIVFFSVIILSAILNIMLISIINSKLGRPIKRLSDSIRHVIDSSFAKEETIYRVYAKNEIGKLSEDFELMVLTMHQFTDELIDQKERVTSAFQDVELLSSIGKDIISRLQISDIIQTVKENLTILIDAPIFAVGIYNEREKELEFWGATAKSMKVGRLGRLSTQNHLAVNVWCFANQNEVFLNRVEEETGISISEFLKSSDGYITESIICLPLSNLDKGIGVLTVSSHHKDAYDDHNLNILRNFAVYITIAIENAVKYQTIGHQNEEILRNTHQLERAYDNLEELVKQRTQEVVSQKEALEAQSKVLERTNKKLENLSLVARETDNAVIIMDADGYFEWVNEGFIRLYGYDLLKLQTEVSDNIMGVHKEEHIKELILKCINTKQTVSYESLMNVDEGGKVWVQTTLTPTLDADGDVKKLVAIDSNIDLIKKAEEQIQEQNKSITSSIRYARRLQAALFPPKEMINNFLPEYFIMNRPKHIVSGDFYWMKAEPGRIMLAVADCTGHGVPGAFMSMLGIAMLDRIAAKRTIQHPSSMLNDLRFHIKSILRQTGKSTKETKDGMDISLVFIDLINMKLEFSGAYNPAYIIRNGELMHLKADKMPIGIYVREKDSFTNHSIDLLENDMLYMFTDGYIDQFSSKTNKKYMNSQFRKLLNRIYNQPMSSQKETLVREFLDWKGTAEQVDDILVMGVRMKHQELRREIKPSYGEFQNYQSGQA